MSDQIRSIIKAATGRKKFAVSETELRWAAVAHDIKVGTGTLRITEDDDVVEVIEFDARMIPMTKAQFTWHRPERIARYVTGVIEDMQAAG